MSQFNGTMNRSGVADRLVDTRCVGVLELSCMVARIIKVQRTKGQWLK